MNGLRLSPADTQCINTLTSGSGSNGPSILGSQQGMGLHGLLIGALQGPLLEGLLFGWLGISGEV